MQSFNPTAPSFPGLPAGTQARVPGPLRGLAAEVFLGPPPFLTFNVASNMGPPSVCLYGPNMHARPSVHQGWEGLGSGRAGYGGVLLLTGTPEDLGIRTDTTHWTRAQQRPSLPSSPAPMRAPPEVGVSQPHFHWLTLGLGKRQRAPAIAGTTPWRRRWGSAPTHSSRWAQHQEGGVRLQMWSRRGIGKAGTA